MPLYDSNGRCIVCGSTVDECTCPDDDDNEGSDEGVEELDDAFDDGDEDE